VKGQQVNAPIAPNPHADGAACLQRVREDASRFGFVTAVEVASIAADNRTRLTPMLVRCGGCRFMCAAQDVKHLIDIITTDGRDYVRDVSLAGTR
jgi:hypothetical protein